MNAANTNAIGAISTRLVYSGLLSVMIAVVALNPTQLVAQVSFQSPDSRLKNLDIKDPAGYRDLAEEISLVKNSQSAKDLTIRLYLICAANSKGKLQRSAIRGLIFSARSESEKQKFKVLSYLTDPMFSDVFDQLVVQTEADKADIKAPKLANSPKQKVLDALLSIRQGKSLRAKKIMENAAVQDYFKRFESIISLQEFNDACLMSELPNGVLLKILKLDLKIRGGNTDFATNKTDNVTEAWRKLFKENLPERIPILTFDSVTEFDPSKSLYQNGVWRKPPK